MNLTKSQIQDLYLFTRQHFVEHYDLQTELVDHLANDIEAMWEDQPQLSFEEAKTKAFKKFGVFGFMEPIEQKQKAMNKRYMRYLWTELKQWFTLPKVIITLTLFVTILLAFSTVYAKYFAIIFYVIIAVWFSYKSILLNRVFKNRKANSNKKWLLEDMIFKQAGGAGFIFLSWLPQLFSTSNNFVTNNYAVIALALVFTIFALISYISLELLPNKAEKLLKETYPEFSL